MMSPPQNGPRGLAPREQQIMDAIYRLGTASVNDVLAELPDSPSYSSVRTMIGQLERKGFVNRDRSSVKHLYSPAISNQSARRSAFQRVIETFFPSAPGDALATLIDDTASKLTADDLNRLEQAIQRARSLEKKKK